LGFWQYGFNTTYPHPNDCVGQIASSFIEDPMTTPDPSSLNFRRPKWILPDWCWWLL